MKKILFPTDGSMGCQKALDVAEDLAKKFDSTVMVLHILDYHKFSNELGYTAVYDNEFDTEPIKEMLQKTVDYFMQKGIKSEFKIINGDPAADIIDEAEKGDYDLCIMCTHGMSPGKRFLLGSVTNKVVHHIRVPIMVIR